MQTILLEMSQLAINMQALCQAPWLNVTDCCNTVDTKELSISERILSNVGLPIMES